ncbi:lactate dehydrogenase-like oxidoreductase [Sphaerochaeta pleomorpha str. Grapes]|uniref:Lactate dehydrogenase-like oxidoreductase n=1 Tax=Sphaerochaeta pleomorpha (strain ATCC BAA-1885 / DSM 22778 / Grapes) TaxID=158190 RepID=G8QSE1_SPHPG|nr:D-isomer specific 2-hydroxyacid dehydrogenase family protein [Sphaerochaeta pleomorpha]AEV30071.1 lactate dehydrogenase-like oxidoreductase [Sphaerochaeta pleomorpha str. Grapes]
MDTVKVTAYASRPDEQASFIRLGKQLDLDIKYVKGNLSFETAEEASGSQGVTILGNCDASEPVLEALAAMGVKFVASRSAGFNNIDLVAAKRLGIRVSNARYSPNCVADFALMLALMVNRRVMVALKRNVGNDYSLPGIQGQEMKNMTIGVMGTGRIGKTVIDNYSGFGCKILAYDTYQNDAVKERATYVDLDTLLSESDIISLHMPLNDETYHIINKETLAKTKQGVKIINTARGELVDTQALIDSLKAKHVAGAGLDVLEGELGIYHTDNRLCGIANDHIAILKSLDNVVATGHMAFYTDQAVDDMVACGLSSLSQFIRTSCCDCEISL